MARDLKTWAKFGPPLGQTWEPTDGERKRFDEIRPLIGNDWTMLYADPPAVDAADKVKPVDLARVTAPGDHEPERINPPAWHGTILPGSDADIWLAAAFADYERIVAREKAIRAHASGGKLGIRDRERLALALFTPTSRYLAAVARRDGHDLALSEVHSDLRSDAWYDIAAGKGVLVLAELRAIMGDKPFDKFMDEFGRAHAGRSVSSASFFDDAEKAHGKPLGDLKAAWLNGDALSKLGADARARKASGRFWSVDSFERHLDKSLIVYGTIAEADSQREAAQTLQRKLACRWANIDLPIKSRQRCDRRHDQGLSHPAGWPARDQSPGGPSGQGAAGPVRQRHPSPWRARPYAHPLTAIVAAGPNPLAANRSVVIFAGLSAEGTWMCPRQFPDHGAAGAEVLLMENGGPIRRLAVPISGGAAKIAAAAAAAR